LATVIGDRVNADEMGTSCTIRLVGFPSLQARQKIAQHTSIREAGFDEYWLQNQISDNPHCPGLGESETLEAAFGVAEE